MAKEPKKVISDRTPTVEKRERKKEISQDKSERDQPVVFTFSDWASI